MADSDCFMSDIFTVTGTIQSLSYGNASTDDLGLSLVQLARQSDQALIVLMAGVDLSVQDQDQEQIRVNNLSEFEATLQRSAYSGTQSLFAFKMAVLSTSQFYLGLQVHRMWKYNLGSQVV